MDYQTEIVRATLLRMIPAAKVNVRVSDWFELRAEFADHYKLNVDSGLVLEPKRAVLWFRREQDKVASFELTRPLIDLSKAERNFLKYFSTAVRSLEMTSSERANTSATRLAIDLAFENIVVAHYLRRSTTGSTFWTPTSLISQLKSLAFQSYEGAACTTGIIHTSDIRRFLRIDIKGYGYISFKKEIEVDDDFFSSPASYRYVDGKNAFYVVDNQRLAHGVLRLANPSEHTGAARANHEHLHSILFAPGSRVWIGMVGDNRDVSVATNKKVLLRWLRGHWQFIDKSIVLDILVAHGCAQPVATELVRHVLMCSERRKGTVVLVPDDDNRRPPLLGQIDRSALGDELRSAAGGLSFELLAAHGAAFGMLTSDGLTTVSKRGVVLGSGEIINSSESGASGAQGGGRTQAAIAASAYGLVIKVSEDGPLSIFIQRTRVLLFEL